MRRIVAIVEGHGEVEAVPILLRRLAEVQHSSISIDVPRPIRIKRQRLMKTGELERTIELAARQCGENGGILILLDADRDCPKDLAAQILERARRARSDRAIRAVVAKVEYESWFLAAMDSIAGKRGIDPAARSPEDSEAIGNPKGWISGQMPTQGRYRETLDQPALTAIFDLTAAGRAPSFAKLCRDVASRLAA